MGLLHEVSRINMISNDSLNFNKLVIKDTSKTIKCLYLELLKFSNQVDYHRRYKLKYEDLRDKIKSIKLLDKP